MKIIKGPKFNMWPYEEQTAMKHRVFQDYFDKWVKILGSRFGAVNYVDGFSGIGAYLDKKKKINFGSPIIAAQTVVNNSKYVKNSTLIFIDKKPGLIKNLKKIVESIGLDKQKNIDIKYVADDFNKTITKTLENVSRKTAPTFVFIDPFGFADVKYDTIKNILEKIPKTEILINFMYNSVTRFLTLSELSDAYNEVFGTDDWKKIDIHGSEREDRIIKLYISQLKKLSKFAFPYRLTFQGKRRTYYYLIHLTNHHLGASIMKSSFAKYSHGRTEWLGIYSNQMKLREIGNIKIEEIGEHLLKEYDKQKINFLKLIEENIDSTPYLENEIKKAIKFLESKGVVYIERFPKLTEKRENPRSSISDNDIIYFNIFPSIERKSLLYKTKVEYGNFTINHILGCSHGCKYPCYAMMMAKSYGKVRNYEQWIHPKIVSNSLELLDREIPKYKKDIDFVHLSFTTDPFMFDPVNKRVYPQIKKLTLQIIERLNKSGIKCTILTKGIYPQELTKEKYNKNNEYGITLVSLDGKFKKEFEPYSAPFEERIKALKLLYKKGLKTWVSIEPYPTPNTVPNSKVGFDLEEILKQISFVDKIIFGKMNYNIDSSKFESNQEFYKKCVENVIRFCKERNIKYHIKEGTPGHTHRTEKIFNGNKSKNKQLKKWIK